MALSNAELACGTAFSAAHVELISRRFDYATSLRFGGHNGAHRERWQGGSIPWVWMGASVPLMAICTYSSEEQTLTMWVGMLLEARSFGDLHCGALVCCSKGHLTNFGADFVSRRSSFFHRGLLIPGQTVLRKLRPCYFLLASKTHAAQHFALLWCAQALLWRLVTVLVWLVSTQGPCLVQARW